MTKPPYLQLYQTFSPRTSSETVFNSLIEQYHYLGYCHPVGDQLKYIVVAKDRPIACLAWSSPPRHIGSRDWFIGWTKEMRERHLSLMASREFRNWSVSFLLLMSTR